MSSKTSSFSFLFYVSKTKLQKSGEAPLLLKINVNGRRIVMNLKQSVNPGDWDSGKGRVAGRNDQAKLVNEYIDAVRYKVRQKYNELIQLNDEITPEMLRDAILGINGSAMRTIVTIWEDNLESMRRLIGKETTKGTCQKYNSALTHLKKYLRWQYRVSDISIKSIDPQFIDNFSLYLRTNGNCGHNTSVKFLQTFRRIILICLRNGWIIKDPFVGIVMKLKVVDRPYLNEEELHRLAEFDTDIDRIARVRDFFLFSCYTGLAYIDVKNLKRQDIEPGESETGYWIRTKRQKTGVRTNVPILEIPYLIINKYNKLESLLPSDPVLPVPSNQKMNAYLKELADLCSIEKELTFHIARHTFATTVTLMNGVPIESVSKMLGHTNLKSTQHYAKVVDKKLGEDMAALAAKLSMKKPVAPPVTQVQPVRRAKRTPVTR
jgi:site-specific recombinase XerD